MKNKTHVRVIGLVALSCVILQIGAYVVLACDGMEATNGKAYNVSCDTCESDDDCVDLTTAWLDSDREEPASIYCKDGSESWDCYKTGDNVTGYTYYTDHKLPCVHNSCGDMVYQCDPDGPLMEDNYHKADSAAIYGTDKECATQS